MAQWSEEDQEKFIKEWNKNHKAEKQIIGKDLRERFLSIVQRTIGEEVEKKIRYTESSDASKRLDAILKRRTEAKAELMKYLQCIRCVSMIAYEDCISADTKKTLLKSGWIIKPRGKKGKRDVVEIKYDLRSRFEWNEKEVQDVFNPNKNKKGAEDQVFTVASNVFEAPASVFAPKEDDRMSCH